MSTLSFILALKVFKAGNPDVELGWEYNEPDRNLVLMVVNSGRADVTISAIELFIVRWTITRRSPISNAFAIRRETIAHIPSKLWRDNDTPTSLRVASHSVTPVSVKIEAIKLPSGLPVDELLLKFVARYPGGKQVTYMRGDHFLEIESGMPGFLPED